VKFAFATYDNQFARNLPFEASYAVAYGLPMEAAWKALTIDAAEIFGVADQTGSLEKGKSADLFLSDGAPAGDAEASADDVYPGEECEPGESADAAV